jgi:hypothetical protein
MFITSAANSIPFDEWISLLAPFAGMAVIIGLVIVWFVREGRNEVLGQIVADRDFGDPSKFNGSLAVEEARRGDYLRLGMSTGTARAWHFWYRWLAGVGEQAKFDTVEFDSSRRQAALSKKGEQREIAFEDIAAIRMREINAGKRGSSAWHLQIVTRAGKSIPFATSAGNYRSVSFENTAGVAKAVAAIVGVPVEVYVAGNVWTAGWPPKARSITTSDAA